MSERIIIATMVHNEAARFWQSALAAWSIFASKVVVLDDGSTDETAAIAAGFANVEYHRFGATSDGGAWGAETSRRVALFERACDAAAPGDWIFFEDADMTPAADPTDLLLDSSAEVYTFRLYDLWREDADKTLWYRHDNYWRAHKVPRVWAIRRTSAPASGWRWSGRGIHSGHLPTNFTGGLLGLAPERFSILHYGYLTEDLRVRKRNLYRTTWAQMRTDEIAHAESIVDKEPALFRLPFEPELRLKFANDI